MTIKGRVRTALARLLRGLRLILTASKLHFIAIGRAMAKRKATKRKSGTRKSAAQRELINTGSDKRFVRRGARGRFKESDEVGKNPI